MVDNIKKKLQAKENEKESKKGSLIIMIVLGVIIAIFVTFSVLINYTNVFTKNWNKNKCKPFYKIFASIIGPKDSNGNRPSYDEVNAECVANITKKNQDENNSAIFNILHHHMNFSRMISDDMNKMRRMFAHIRNSFEAEVKDIQHKVYDTFERLAYVFRVFEKLFVRLFITFADIFEQFKYGFFLFASLWNGPIGDIFRFFCFDANTIINNKPIKYICINDYIDNNSKVYGRFIFDANQAQMYLYKNKYLVSGNHFVHHKNEWKMIKETSNCYKLKKYNAKHIYCLATTNGEIKINNDLFMDYFYKISDINQEQIFEKSLQTIAKFNNLQVNSHISFIYKPWYCNIWALHGSTYVNTEKGKKLISQINVGDVLENNIIVTGWVEFDGKIMKDLYKFEFEGCDTIICQGNTILLEGDTVGVVRDNKNFKLVTEDYSNDRFYHLFTNHGIFECGFFVFADFDPETVFVPDNTDEDVKEMLM